MSHPPSPGALVRITVWDLPVRAFHWLIVALITISWVSAEQEKFEVHFWAGYAVLTLLIFRLVWGVIGSTTARFGHFVRGPRAALANLSEMSPAAAAAKPSVGHDALGGWAVMVLLVLVAVQAGTGLFTTDDLFVDGPLASTVSSDLRGTLSMIHRQGFWTMLMPMIGVHVLAIALYIVLRREDLVGPMITGRKSVPAAIAEAQPLKTAPLLSAGGVLIAAAVVVWLVAG